MQAIFPMCHAKTMSVTGRKNLKTCFQKCHDSVKIEQDFSRQRMTSALQKCANKENAMVSAQSRKRKREAMHLEMQQENWKSNNIIV